MCESSADLRILCGRRPCKLMYSIDDGYGLLKQHHYSRFRVFSPDCTLHSVITHVILVLVRRTPTHNCAIAIHVSLRRSHTFIRGYWLLKQHPCSHANAEALVSHFVTCIYVRSLQLSWIQYTWRLHYLFLCIPLRPSTKLAQIYKRLNVCSWLLQFFAWIRVEFLPRVFRAELCRQSECVRADIGVYLRWNIEDFFRKMDVIHVRYRSSYVCPIMAKGEPLTDKCFVVHFYLFFELFHMDVCLFIECKL